MFETKDIFPLSDFNRKSAEHIKKLNKSGKAEILTVNGKAAVVMIAPEAFDQLNREADLARSLRKITLANNQFENGDGISLNDGFSKLRELLSASVLDEKISD